MSISNLCTVFAESEVISHLAAGVSQANVAAGAIHSIATRIVGMAGRVGVEPQVVMTGGGALNGALVDALSQSLHQPVQVLGNPQVMGGPGGRRVCPGVCPKAGRAGHCLKPFRHSSKIKVEQARGGSTFAAAPGFSTPLENTTCLGPMTKRFHKRVEVGPVTEKGIFLVSGQFETKRVC